MSCPYVKEPKNVLSALLTNLLRTQNFLRTSENCLENHLTVSHTLQMFLKILKCLRNRDQQIHEEQPFFCCFLLLNIAQRTFFYSSQ